jgi:hypothetical protein
MRKLESPSIVFRIDVRRHHGLPPLDNPITGKIKRRRRLHGTADPDQRRPERCPEDRYGKNASRHTSFLQDRLDEFKSSFEVGLFDLQHILTVTES